MKKTIFFTILIMFASIRLASAQEAIEQTQNTEIQDSVDQRLETVRNRLKAMIGTVTDKTEDTMQLETASNEIRLISIDENASFASTNGSSGSLGYEDIGIGDYIIAMGKIDENSVLVAQRIVVSTQPEELTREVVYAAITQTEDDYIATTIPGENEILFEIDRNTDISEKEEDGTLTSVTSNALSINDKIILIGSTVDEVFEVSRIHIVEQAPEEE